MNAIFSFLDAAIFDKKSNKHFDYKRKFSKTTVPKYYLLPPSTIAKISNNQSMKGFVIPSFFYTKKFSKWWDLNCFYHASLGVSEKIRKRKNQKHPFIFQNVFGNKNFSKHQRFFLGVFEFELWQWFGMFTASLWFNPKKLSSLNPSF